MGICEGRRVPHGGFT